MNHSGSHLETTNKMVDPTISVPSDKPNEMSKHRYGPLSL